MTSARRARALALLAGESEEAGGLSVREAVMIGRYAHRPWWDWRRTDEDAAVVERALRRVALLGFADRPMRSLSSGERARALLALALAQGAQTLLLDEPTSHLDVRFAHEVLQLLRAIARRGATVVAVLHDLNEAAAYADRVAVLCEGRILCYAGPRASLDPQVLEMAYGMPFEPLETPRGYRVVAAHGATATLARDARPSF